MREVSYGWALVAATILGTAGTVAVGGLAVAAGDVPRGKLIYEKNCQGCHGKTGAGLGGATPNLTDPKRMAALTDQHLFDVVTTGRPGTGMPAWGSTLTEPDRWNVVSYLRTLAQK
jgi:mono/diheme cytochrome c family protein